MVTPSLVTSGDPVIRSRITLRPFGPRGLFTEAASCSTPAWSRWRASAPKRSSLAMGSSDGPRVGTVGYCAGGTGRAGPPGRGKRPPGGAGGPSGGDCPAGSLSRGGGPRNMAGGGRREVESQVLGGVLGVGEHDRPVVLVHHPPVVGGHALLEVGRGERARLLAEGLGEFVVDEVGPGFGVHADHRRQVRDGHACLVLHDVGDHVTDLVVHQGDAGTVGRGLVDRAERARCGGGHWASSFGVSRPRSVRIPANRFLACSSESSKRGGRWSGVDQSGCIVRAAARTRGTQAESQPSMSCRLWSANSRSCTSGPKHAFVQARSRWA